MKKAVVACAGILLCLGLLAGCDTTLVGPGLAYHDPGDTVEEKTEPGIIIPDGDIPEGDDPDGDENGGTGDNNPNNPDNPNTDGDEPSTGDKDTGAGPVQSTTITGEHFLGIDYSDGVYYFDGEVYSSFYGEVTQDVTKAVIVTVEEVTGGYTLSFEDDGNTQYIQMAESGEHRNFVWGNDPYTWTYDETYEAFITTDSGGTTYYIGTYGTYVEMALNEYGYLTGDKSTDYAQYPAHLYDVVTLTAPTSITITGASEVEEGSRITLTATVDEGANPNVTWSSSNTGVATVSDTGVVTGVAEGTADITATSVADPNVSATVTITVKAKSEENPDEETSPYTLAVTTDTIINNFKRSDGTDFATGSGGTPDSNCQLEGYTFEFGNAFSITFTKETGGGDAGARLWSDGIRVYINDDFTIKPLGDWSLNKIVLTYSMSDTSNLSLIVKGDGTVIATQAGSTTSYTLENASAYTEITAGPTRDSGNSGYAKFSSIEVTCVK